ncbi:glycosyltransferase [Siccirubricoccus sp. KC 17139]|uniref:Glycosyltransferase n=1 Tax=Siccirubricoccus soli TaxID=2899147 RepID=A0ABT1DBR5_9PROT|nr:glycosyltransferase [Siccirubricoccus soli]MCO6419386.1 glycosyltransferase [Siccirubricoccus soli]MCP2685521.1 glycosyltransferase [Siccirubricoccus soli]
MPPSHSRRNIIPHVSRIADKPLLLCLSHLRWDFVFQRPQHLLTRAARSHRVLFFEEPLRRAPAPGLPRLELRRTPEGVEIATPLLPDSLDEAASDAAQRALLDELLGGEQPAIAWYYTPMALAFTAHLHPGLAVYDCMDELSAFLGASPRLLLLGRRLLQQVDIVFTGGRSLYEAKRGLHPSVHQFTSGVDVAHFGQAREPRLAAGPGPADQAGIPRPRLGWFGVVDERMDLALVDAVAARRPDWSLVMVGPVVKIDPASLPRRPNIHWLGGKAMAELPAYLAGWDCGLMPFAMNESTRFISPTKTPEYLAAGVPLVSTPVVDVVRDWGAKGLVAIAADAEQVTAAAEAAMARPRLSWWAEADRHLAGCSWDSIWSAMQELIQARAAAKTAGGGSAVAAAGQAHV